MGSQLALKSLNISELFYILDRIIPVYQAPRGLYLLVIGFPLTRAGLCPGASVSCELLFAAPNLSSKAGAFKVQFRDQHHQLISKLIRNANSRISTPRPP